MNTKLRSWNQESNRFYYFENGRYYYDAGCKQCVSERICDEFQWRKAEQFTGLHDKNGKEIFENDILSNKTAQSMYSEYGEKYVVTYNDKTAQFTCGYQFGIVRYMEIGAEVIGNIHEEPTCS